MAISGVITAMVTPFDDGGGLDVDAARRLARHLAEHGSHGLVLAGTTGESPTLSDDEKLALLRAVRDEVGDELTLICGTGSNDTRHSVELTRAAAAEGADAVLVVTPYYNKPNRAGLRAHFEAVAVAAGDVPVVLYNIPSRCVINLPPDLLAELARIDNVVAVKQANNEELRPIDGLEILAGNDEIFLRTLEIGGAGGILVSSHLVGSEMRAVYESATAGDLDRAREIDAGLRGIYEAMTVTANPIPVKTGLEMLGVIDATLRLPMVPADDEQRGAVRSALERQGLLATSAG
ncbi:MAG TPA: 4-hydroxy-tetrahydrodipicolinate synthase [Solirubrobacterales bacterium]|nr:4-hydroxy-tetrahydrodipicolinate synthase [Solirubrobacterales bacterium]